jgi:hypothetical protein
MIIFEDNNIVILCLTIFYLNYNQHVNSYRYKIFSNPAVQNYQLVVIVVVGVELTM